MDLKGTIKLTLGRGYTLADPGEGYSGRAMMMGSAAGDLGDNAVWTVSPVLGGGTYQLRNLATGNLLAQDSTDAGLVVAEQRPSGPSAWDFRQMEPDEPFAVVVLGSSADQCLGTGPVPPVYPPMNVPARLMGYMGQPFMIEQIS